MPRSIYARLRNRKDEDFLTEVFAETLARVPTLRFQMIEHLTGRSDLQVLHISTQAVHGQDQPDIQVDAVHDDGRPIRVLIESKLESEEGWKQLPRYAALLRGWVARGTIAEGCLVYLTAYYDPKNPEDILDNVDEGRVRFRQSRWEDVYEVVRRALPDLGGEAHVWARELARYLEDRKLNTPTQFSPEQIVGLAQLPELIRLVDACMDGDVWPAFKAVAGETDTRTVWAKQLRDHDRFFYYVHQSDSWWIGLGFLMRDPTTAGYPDVAVILETSRKHSRYAELATTFADFLHQEESWGFWRPKKNWTGVAARRSLRAFLGEADQVDAVKKWFVGRLAEVAELKKDNPELPWRTGSDRIGEG